MPKMVVMCVKIWDDVLKELDSYASREGISRSEAVRRAVDEFLSKHKDKSDKITVKRVVLSPPDLEPDIKTDGAFTPRPKCEDIYKDKVLGTMSWADVAKKYGFVTKNAAREWFRRNCTKH